MLTKEIQEFFAVRPAPGPECPFRPEELAAAALMVECAEIDGDFTEAEFDAIRRAVREELGLDDETAESLLKMAEMREDQVWHDWLFTEEIKKHLSPEEQFAVIRRLWEVALADGALHRFEEHLVTRIANELGFSEEAIDESRVRAIERLSRGETKPGGPAPEERQAGEGASPC